MLRSLLAAALLALLAGPALALDTSAGRAAVTAEITGLEEPWGIAFLPDGGILVTERDGRLLHIRPDGTRLDVSGVPEVEAEGQGGLLDVMVPRDFAETREVFLSFSIRQDDGAGTALAAGSLSADGTALEGTRVIFEMSEGSSGGRHFGSRIVEAADGHLFLTTGDRGNRPSAQDLSRHNGSVIRIARDGSVPADNPFTGTPGAEPEIWSYGHRNPQGAALDADGTLWVNEHGARGGDEVNRIAKGANYGWPIISYGTHYSGAKIGIGTAQDGMEQPVHYWDPSIAPSGMMIYSGALWPEWAGDIFVGSLKFGLISRLDRDGDRLTEAERIEDDETARVRDIVEAPDGAIWFLSVGQGAAYRMVPGG
ncbi:PQQ-dependent sugar dehydrogenase [Ovoidimarina sediminis]|uniref:PQQ-dependent sugar dehydrogenase n=1 Tax=Ovoidimarina sediminis TaxID=3079856 RepID=UPI00291431EF|nr:PQQ-dependent sugar dehydrogenase [Rhodophyticola sp. MJ-SS7]MDU8941982.1 PQQ-dependent sugar dehydrogenase [Rhodophyticola sp. MJ-SS7]